MFNAKHVAKTHIDVQGEAQIWGEWVHKQFENYIDINQELPEELQSHKKYLDRLREKPGHYWCEQKIGLDTKGQPCTWFVPWVFWRGKLDFKKISPEREYGAIPRTATLVDYKTGKVKQDFSQLMWYAIHTFAECPDVELVNAQFYWTQTEEVSKQVYGRGDIPKLWAHFMPDLKQYKEAFITDTWQPRPNGLCKGWCPKTDCPFWSSKR